MIELDPTMKSLFFTFISLFFHTIAIATPIESYRLPKKIFIGSQNCYSNSLKLFQVLRSYIPTELINDSDCKLDDGTTITKKVEKGEIPNAFARDWVPTFLETNGRVTYILNKQFPSNNLLKSFTGLNYKEARLPFAGGNLQVDQDGMCMFAYPKGAIDSPGFDEILQRYKEIGCSEILRLEPAFAERTQHIDIFLQIIGKKEVLLADYSSNENKKANEVMVENLKLLQSKGYVVHRIRQPGTLSIGGDFVHISYVNSLIIGNTAFVPRFSLDHDANAIADFKNSGMNVVPVEQDFPWYFGSIHCLTGAIY